LKKEETEAVTKEPTKESDTAKVQNDEENEGAEEASGSSWWGMDYSSMLNKAVSSVSIATTAAALNAAELAKQKSSEVYGLVSKDLEDVSTQATSMVRSSSMTLKKTLEWDWYYSDPTPALCGDNNSAMKNSTSICTSMMPTVTELIKMDEKSDELADQAYGSVKSSVTSAWRYAAGYATQMFTEEDLEAEALLVQGQQQEPVILNRLQAQLYALATDPDTFLTEPHPDDADEFTAWKPELDKRQGEISELMVSNANIRKNYSTLVPEKVNHNLFWTRYFFKVHLIELQENKRQILKKRAAEVSSANDEEINWDDVADLAGNSNSDSKNPGKDIPDDVQDKLLSEYEKELIEAKVKKVDQNLKTQLKIKEKQTSPDKEETSSDDWEKLSSGEKSPRKQSKEEDEDWVQP